MVWGFEFSTGPTEPCSGLRHVTQGHGWSMTACGRCGWRPVLGGPGPRAGEFLELDDGNGVVDRRCGDRLVVVMPLEESRSVRRFTGKDCRRAVAGNLSAVLDVESELLG